MANVFAAGTGTEITSRVWRHLTERGPLVPLLILLGACVLQVLAGYSAIDLSGHAWGADDAYITYRYIGNLLSGHGLVFNPGEHVEGYSAFLYALLLAGLASILKPAMYPLSVIVNMIFAGLALLCFFRHIEARFGRRNANIAAFLFALCPPLWVAVASGLETPLVLFLQLTVWTLSDRVVRSPRPATACLLSVSLVLLILARADGFVFAAIVLVYLGFNGQLTTAAKYAIAVSVLCAPYFLWRHSYYGEFLPNTYYAKVTGTVYQRVRYATRELMSLATSVGLLPYLMLTVAAFSVAFSSIRYRRAKGGESVPFEALAGVGWVGYWLYIGGDTLSERFLLVLFALGISALIRGLQHDLESRAGAFLLAMVLLLQLSPLGTDARFHFTLDKYDRWKTLGRFLGERYPGRSLAVDAAGKVPYFSGLYTIDMLGLADTYVAHREADFTIPGHSKFDAQYVLRRKPDLIAAFIGRGLDLGWGISKKRYEAAGYRLRYLVNTGKLSAQTFGWPDILDVGSRSDQEISNFVWTTYGYAVLERK